MITKEQVKERLIKQGNSTKDVEEMVNMHFEYAVLTYKTMKQVTECIRTIY